MRTNYPVDEVKEETFEEQFARVKDLVGKVVRECYLSQTFEVKYFTIKTQKTLHRSVDEEIQRKGWCIVLHSDQGHLYTLNEVMDCPVTVEVKTFPSTGKVYVTKDKAFFNSKTFDIEDLRQIVYAANQLH